MSQFWFRVVLFSWVCLRPLRQVQASGCAHAGCWPGSAGSRSVWQYCCSPPSVANPSACRRQQRWRGGHIAVREAPWGCVPALLAGRCAWHACAAHRWQAAAVTPTRLASTLHAAQHPPYVSLHTHQTLCNPFLQVCRRAAVAQGRAAGSCGRAGGAGKACGGGGLHALLLLPAGCTRCCCYPVGAAGGSGRAEGWGDAASSPCAAACPRYPRLLLPIQPFNPTAALLSSFPSSAPHCSWTRRTASCGTRPSTSSVRLQRATRSWRRCKPASERQQPLVSRRRRPSACLPARLAHPDSSIPHLYSFLHRQHQRPV